MEAYVGIIYEVYRFFQSCSDFHTFTGIFCQGFWLDSDDFVSTADLDPEHFGKAVCFYVSVVPAML